MDTDRGIGHLTTAWLVLVLALLYAVALSGVQLGLGERIAENKRQATYKVIPGLVPGAVREATAEVAVALPNGNSVRVYRALDQSGTQVGWVLPADGLGFADRIEILIGVDPGVTRITGLYVLEQKETPGLGDNIRSTAFCSQYAGLDAAVPVMAVKGEPQDSEIRALTGATISSESVCTIVNDAIARLREPLQTLAAAAGGA